MSALTSPVTQLVSFSSNDGFAVTPSDSNMIYARIFYVGGAGDITLVTPAGSTLTFKSVPIGFFYVSASKIKATGTTATNIIALV